MTDALLAAVVLSLASLGMAIALLSKGSGSRRHHARRTMGASAALGGIALLLLALLEPA